jgi:tetratricopeptide (TPR) repeat protein
MSIDLENYISKKGEDSIAAGKLIHMFEKTKYSDPFSALQYAARALQIFEQIDNKHGIAEADRCIGDNYFYRKIFALSMDSYTKALDVYTQINDTLETAYTYLKVGDTYLAQKLDKNALTAYETAREIFERLKNQRGISFTFDKLALINMSRYDDKGALELLNKSLEIRKKLNDLALVGLSNENIADIYIQNEDNQSAANFLKRALVIYILMDNKLKTADMYFKLGELYIDNDAFEDALESFEKALLYYKDAEIEDKAAQTQTRLGFIYLQQKKYKEAQIYIEKAYFISSRSGYTEIQSEAFRLLSDVYSAKKNIAMAFKYMKLHSELEDSLNLERQNQQSTELQVNLATQKKEQEIKILEKDKALKTAQLDKQSAEKKFLFIGLALLVAVLAFSSVFGIYFYKTNKETKKANNLLIEKNEEINKQKEEILNQRDKLEDANISITQQKNEIEAASEKITSSINYAGRIQRAMLPKMSEIKMELPDSFVMLSPKEAVSGDFIWYGVTEDEDGNKKVILTAVDCTGHGVPGAFMSMIGDAYLNQIIYQQKITSPNLILQELHKGIRASLQQDRSENTDGMDIALIVIDPENKYLEYAGAKNPLVYIQNNGLNIIKGEIYSIGGLVKEGERIFENHKVDISQPTWIYIYSDGFQDQFGSSSQIKNRKYMAKRFRDFLFEIHQLPMNEQAVALAVELDDWRGDYPQMDDVLIIGAKI